MFDDNPFVKDFGNVGKRDSGRVIEKLGDANGCRTGYSWTPDGWVRLQTHGGVPRTYPVTMNVKMDDVPPIPDHYIFQMLPRVEIGWPSSPIATTAELLYQSSKDPAIVVEETETNAKGDCEWFGASPRVVTWFGLNSSGRQASSMFYWRMSTLSRHKPVAHSVRREIQREAVWVDGEKWFDLPLNRAPVCAAMCGDLLRVIAIDQTLAGTTTEFSNGGSSGTNLAEIISSPLYLYEGTQDAMTMMRTVTFDLGSHSGYMFLQSFFFSQDGEKAVGIIGIKTGAKTVEPRIIEVAFGSGAETVNKSAVQTLGVESGELVWEITRPTGLPSGGDVVIASASGDPSGTTTPFNTISASGIQYAVAAEYRHSDGKLVFLYRKEFSVYGDPITQEYASTLVKDFEYYRLDTGDICDSNHDSIVAAYAAKGQTAPEDYGIRTGLPGYGDGTPSGGGSYGWSPTGGTSYSRRDYVWGVKKQYSNSLSGSRALEDVHYVVKDVDGNELSDFFSKQKSLVHTRVCDTDSYNGFPSDPFSVVPTTLYTGGTPNIAFGMDLVTFTDTGWVNGAGSSGGMTLIDVDESADDFDILACDLRTDTYVVKTPSGRNVIRGFPSNKSGNWTPGILDWTTKTAPEDVSSLTISDLDTPFFGIENMASYLGGGHIVFSSTDIWSGGTLLSHWSPSAGISAISTSGQYEAPIYFRGP